MSKKKFVFIIFIIFAFIAGIFAFLSNQKLDMNNSESIEYEKMIVFIPNDMSKNIDYTTGNGSINILQDSKVIISFKKYNKDFKPKSKYKTLYTDKKNKYIVVTKRIYKKSNIKDYIKTNIQLHRIINSFTVK